MNNRVLFVDDEPRVLQAFERQLRKAFCLSFAGSGLEGLSAIEQSGPFAVVVADMRMPQMDGIQFLLECKQRAPQTVRVMLTGNRDLETSIQAVNDGNVFRFLNKPCPTDVLIRTVNAGLEQYRLLQAEKELLEGTLNGSIKLLSEILSIVAPHEFSRASSSRSEARVLGKALGLQDTNDLELAAMFSPIACVTLPPETLAKSRTGAAMSAEELRAVERMPEIASNLLANIPRLEQVARIIHYRQKHFDGTGFPEGNTSGQSIPIESRILKGLHDLMSLEEMDGSSRAKALDQMTRTSGVYDPAVLQALASIAGEQQTLNLSAPREVLLVELRNGDVVMSCVETMTGSRLLSPGQSVTPALIERLLNFHSLHGIKEPILVMRK
jgi:response regulator RpfG family c-di-GMP phosphodiesterase